MTEYPYSASEQTESRPAWGADTRDSSLDQPLDAIVYDVHPAAIERWPGFYRAFELLNLRTEPAKYKVPQRFGMSAILGIMTALALLFGSFHILNADPVVYLFFGVQTVLICVLQMFNDKTPRAASVIAGAIMAPFFTVRLIDAAGIPVPYSTNEQILWTVMLAPFSVPMGVLLGYLTGACAAGIFLVMDYLEPYLHGYALGPNSSARPTT